MADRTNEIKSACTAAVLNLFPDICTDYLEKIATDLQYDHGQVIDEILSCIENGKSYPKKPRTKVLKRKRGIPEEADETSKLRRRYDYVNRPKEMGPVYISVSKKVLAQDFPRATMKSIVKLLEQNDNLLMRTYLALDEINRNWQEGNLRPGFEMKKTRTVPNPELTPAQLDQTINNSTFEDKKRALEELRAARKICEAEAAKRNSAKDKQCEEKENLERAKENGTATECGCCFGDFAMNRMVHCSRTDNVHYFCVECARRNAETAIGLTKYELTCMSTDGCNAGFSHSQRSIFLDDRLIAALDRIECEAVLRIAGVQNLETCPFCPFAAEYPPVEENKEFRCANPECQVVSCRLCRDETHIPRTCEEAARENGLSARREIEEAMSAALIRKCNKCFLTEPGGTPFIKEEGCNKMTCTRSGCHNVQCYVCSKSCDYTHFDDSARGGKKGNCPLFEVAKERHDREVHEAEEKARQKVMDDNPDLDEELLKFDTPEALLENEAEKRKRMPQQNAQHMPIYNDIHFAQRYMQQAQLFARDRFLRGNHNVIPPNIPPPPPQPRPAVQLVHIVHGVDIQANQQLAGQAKVSPVYVQQAQPPPAASPGPSSQPAKQANHAQGNQPGHQWQPQTWQPFHPLRIVRQLGDGQPRPNTANFGWQQPYPAIGGIQQAQYPPANFNMPVPIVTRHSPMASRLQGDEHSSRPGSDGVHSGAAGDVKVAENLSIRAQPQVHHTIHLAAAFRGPPQPPLAIAHSLSGRPSTVNLTFGQPNSGQPQVPRPMPFAANATGQNQELAKLGKTPDNPLELD
nr:ring finger domain-containing protein [Colletotrichum truncatum]KAF6788249.1 ring finger domain-containing protein [Colletotrichum truncatum]